MSQTRQLAAIMFTDIVGFTALMGSDEKRTFELLEQNRSIHKPVIAKCNGVWIKELGDGVMASFGTVSDAVRAAIQLQETCNELAEYQLSIGIHAAEVVFENDDVFGNGVNIAARIQSACPPGCILVSEAVFINIANNREIRTHFVKAEKLKNVREPVRLYQVLTPGIEPIVPGSLESAQPEKSIAVLPFENMSSDPEQEYFSDGISEEIINMLAQVPELKVIGRTSSFAFKGRNLDLKVIGKELGARFLLEGSVRKSGNMLRITAQLIKAEDGFHLYSEKFDRKLEDVFAIQDEISLAILDAIKMKLLPKNKKALLKKYTDNLEAYQLYLKGRFYQHQGTLDGMYKAIAFYDQAIAIDPNYALAYVDISFCTTYIKDFNWDPSPEIISRGFAAAEKALELDDQIAESHIAVGRIQLHQRREVKKAFRTFQTAHSINPNSAECLVQLGFCLTLMGNFEEAIEHALQADELEPLSAVNLFFAGIVLFCSGAHKLAIAYGQRLVDMAPGFFAGYWVQGWGQLGLANYSAAVALMESALQYNPGSYVLGHLGVSYGLDGQTEKARDTASRLIELQVNEPECNHSIGHTFASIGEWDAAFDYYNRSVDNNEGQALWIKLVATNLFPECSRDPRARLLFERIGQPGTSLAWR